MNAPLRVAGMNAPLRVTRQGTAAVNCATPRGCTLRVAGANAPLRVAGMTRRSVLLVIVVLLTLTCVAPVMADDHTPKPYSPDEFNAWMKQLWRADAVAVGSFPFSLFLTLEVYDTFRFVSNGFNTSYAPWPIGSGSAVTYSTTETAWLAVSAVSLSLLVAGIDWFIGLVNERSAKD